MASFLRSWLPTLPYVSLNSLPNPPDIQTSPPSADDDDDGSNTEKEDNDEPPAFPSLNSAQRMTTGDSSIPKILTDSQLMPPPPAPQLASRTLGVPPSRQGGLAVLTTVKPPLKASKKREKVALAPGHSPLDWAALKSSGQDLRGTDSLMRIPPSVLKQHNTRTDAWAVFNGKVYNITPYLPFHPGGEKELMRVAGRDGNKAIW